jgi:hypothetical protein
MKTAALAQVSKTGSRPIGESPASTALKTDWAVGETLPQSLQPSSNTQAAAKNGSSGRDSHRQIPKHRPCFPLPLATNLKWGSWLVQPRIVRRLTA